MKNEPHVIGDRVPNEHALIAELKLVSPGAGGKALAPVTYQMRFPHLPAILRFLGRTLQQRRNQLALLELNDEQLKDIGLSRCQAYGDGYSRYRRDGTDDADTEA
ncbi:DUF1127 domain-containing protein [Pararhizobium sp. PWRC1-1]|uniref:DUF1127 domain-containing protein n=1 Tax=Pararhizobium sp. PWRC1-1 TaxID=2804566 RepID=UPI003CF5DFAC